MKKLTKQNLEELAQQMVVIDTATQAKFIGGGDPDSWLSMIWQKIRGGFTGGGDGSYENPWTYDEWESNPENRLTGGNVFVDGQTMYFLPELTVVNGISHPLAMEAVQYLNVTDEHTRIVQKFWNDLDKHYGVTRFSNFAEKDKNWCAAFVSSCALNAGYDIPENAHGVRFWLDYGTSVSHAEVQPGDIGLYEQGHIAIVGDVNGDSIYIIHGNTSVGWFTDGVSAKWVLKSDLTSFKRL